MTNVLKMLAICIAFLIQSNPTSAKMHFLPDYQHAFGGRGNDADDAHDHWKDDSYEDQAKTENNMTSKGICPNGWFSASEIGDRKCTVMGSYPGIGICYANCKCDTSIYKYTASQCTNGYTCSGVCNDGTVYYKTRSSSSCSSDYYTDVSSCGTNAHGTYALTGATLGYSDGKPCRKCVLTCNNGWEGTNCSTKKACPSGYYTSCSNPANGTATKSNTCNGYSGDDKCCTYTVKCSSGYTISGSNCGATCVKTTPSVTCTYSTHAACMGAIAGAATCVADSNGCYQLDTCQSGYEKSLGSCSYCNYNGLGYTLSNCPSNATCADYTCGGKTKYKFTGCKSGYTASGTTCVATVSTCGDFETLENGVCVATRYVYLNRTFVPESTVLADAQSIASVVGQVCYDDDGDGILRSGDPDKTGTICGDNNSDGAPDVVNEYLRGYLYNFDDDAMYIVYGSGIHPNFTNTVDDIPNLKFSLDNYKSKFSYNRTMAFYFGYSSLPTAIPNYLQRCKEALDHTELVTSRDTYDMLYPTPEVLGALATQIKYEGGTIMPLQLGATYMVFKTDTNPAAASNIMYLGKTPTNGSSYTKYYGGVLGNAVDYYNAYMQNNGFFADSYYAQNGAPSERITNGGAKYKSIMHDQYVLNSPVNTAGIYQSIWPIHMYCMIRVSRQSCSFSSGYSFQTCPTNGVCSNETCGSFTRYKLNSCNSGYYKSGGNCLACTYTTEADCIDGITGAETCTKNSTTRCYELATCGDGYTKSGSTCVADDTDSGEDCSVCTFDGYPLTSESGANATTWAASDECCGEVQYKITGCSTGYEPNSEGSACTATACPDGYYTLASSCGTVTNGSYSLGSDIGGYNGATACKNCVLSCDTGYELNSTQTACDVRTCPTGYATTYTECSGNLNGTGEWMLDTTSADGKSGSEFCYKCVVDCNSGYEANSDKTACIATTCPTGYAKSVSECSIIASPSQYSGYGFYYANVGKYTLGSKDAKGCGACIAECNSGYVLGLTDGVAPGVTLAACLPESCPTGYAKSVNECTTNKIIATPAQYNGYQFSPGSSGYFSLGSKDAKGCGACIANCNSSTALTNVASGLVACTGCPSGYYTSCPSVVDGTATKTSTCSGSLGGVSCCKCEITCRSGYVLNSSTGNCEFNAAAVLKVTVKAYALGSNNITVKLINTGNNSTTSKSVVLNGSSSASLLTSSVMEFSGVYSGSTYSLVAPQENGCVGVGALISDYDSSDCYLQSSFDFSRYGSQYGMPGQCYYPGTYNNSTGVLFTLAPGTTDVVVYVQCS